jgi:cell division FtsZ-interacting protein ZapD
LLRELKGKLNIHLTIIHVPSPPARTRLLSDSEKQRVKIEKWLDEVVQCDEVVLNVLLANIQAHKIAICADDCDVRQLESVSVAPAIAAVLVGCR